MVQLSLRGCRGVCLRHETGSEEVQRSGAGAHGSPGERRHRYAGSQALFDAITGADQSNQAGVEAQRGRVAELKKLLAGDDRGEAKSLSFLADYLVRKTVWGIGGDGWGYDIGYGGVDQVMASGENVNLMILDTEVYSNTGGQMSKSTPLGATAQFAAAGKKTPKKNIGAMMVPYGNVYVAQIAFGANPAQTVRAMQEAESFDGPSLIVAYSTCINQGIADMAKGVDVQKKAVAAGHWPLFRYNPRLEAEGKNPLVLDCAGPEHYLTSSTPTARTASNRSRGATPRLRRN